jgi:hypothetical protein
MTGKKKRVLDLDQLLATKKVRYGRANLSVSQMVSVHLTPVEQVLRFHRQGKVSPEDVAWAFVKEQVTSHTPSFKWGDANLDKLLPRIISVAKDPKLKARNPNELIPELEAIGEAERERWRKLNERIRKSIAPKLTSDIGKFQALYKAAQPPPMPGLEKVTRELAKSIRPEYAEMMKAVAPSMKAFDNVRVDWEKISKAILPQLPTKAALGIDLKAYEGLLSSPVADAIGKELRVLDQWSEIARQVADAANASDSADVAEAVEATAGEATDNPAEVDLTPLFERLDGISKKLEKLDVSQAAIRDQIDQLHEKSDKNQKALEKRLAKLEKKHSATRALLLTVAGGLILYFIKIILAAQCGIVLPPK